MPFSYSAQRHEKFKQKNTRETRHFNIVTTESNAPWSAKGITLQSGYNNKEDEKNI